MDKTSIIMVLLCSILTVGIVILIFLNVSLRSKLIDPSKCPIVNGEFGVMGGMSYQVKDGMSSKLAAISKCDGVTPGMSLCTAKAADINDAIAYCYSYPTFCDAFVYSVGAKEVTIVDPTQLRVTDANYDLYQIQHQKITS